MVAKEMRLPIHTAHVKTYQHNPLASQQDRKVYRLKS
jgi:hypothetical protein